MKRLSTTLAVLVCLLVFALPLYATDYSGTYYVGVSGTRPGGGDPDFLSMKAVFDSLSTAGATFSGNCTFYITSDITEPNTGGKGIGLAVDPGSFTITFKPYTALTPTITNSYPSDGNTGPSGAFVIGMNSAGMAWADLKTTRNIIFDGSNTPGGITRDLTIQSATTAVRNAMGITFVGDVANCTVKNCNVYYQVQTVSTSGSLFIGAILIRSATAANTLTVEKIPANLTFDNNYLKANFAGVAQCGQGIGVYASAATTVMPNNIVIHNNKIEGKRRGIGLWYAGSTEIYGNEIILNQDINDGLTNEAIFCASVLTGSTVNIYNNKISSVASINSTANTTGNAGISVETNGTYNIYNNMICGFALNSVNANISAYVYGIKNSSATATANIYHNTIQMENLASLGAGAVKYYGIYLSDGTNTLKNNIVVNNEDDFASFNIYRPNVGTLTSDYNDFYRSGTVNAQIGFYDASNTSDLTAWKTASSQDANSKSVAVTFASSTDLHLNDSYKTTPDYNLGGTPIPSVTTDIDGQTRDAFFPYMGADEIVVQPLPAELTNFCASTRGPSVELTWSTATETNNYGFEVERRELQKSEWMKVGFVAGHGTSTIPQTYSYTDASVTSGTFVYRLKQIDNTGLFKYSQSAEVTMGLPQAFELSQNYPNPFNPSTTLSVMLSKPQYVRLAVYNMVGQEVSILADENLAAGVYQYTFNAYNLASGTYFARIQTQEFTKIVKMLLMK